MNRKINLIVLLLVVISFGSEVAEAKEYPDVSQENAHYVAIEELSREEVLEGYPDGTFKPEQPINRAEALKVILKAFQKEEIGASADGTDKSFPDVIPDDWFNGFVQQGVRYSIVEGYVDGTFKPGNQVLFSESLKMAMVAKPIDLSTYEYKEFHPSVLADDWFSKYFSYGYEKNYFSLEDNGSLNPNRPFTRGEFVDLIYRIRKTEAGQSFDLTYNWEDKGSDKGLNVSVPITWDYYTLGDGLFLGYFAGQNPTFIKNVPNGARISINFWKNENNTPAVDYFAQIKQNIEAEFNSLNIEYTEEEGDIGPSLRVLVAEKGVYEYYVMLENGSILIAEGSFDSSSLKASDLIKEIGAIYDNIKYNPSLLLNSEQKLAMARQSINVEKKGKEILDLFIGKELIHTDAVGVGTGPVDYYYIEGINYTIKYERSFDVILDLTEGKTSQF